MADAKLIVSVLVTNAVVQTQVAVDQVVTVEALTVGDRLRLVVSDPGSHLQPHLAVPDAEALRRYGLLLVDALATGWAVTHAPVGTTQVWAELKLAG